MTKKWKEFSEIFFCLTTDVGEMAPQRPLKVVVMITALGRVEKLMEVLRQFVSDSVCELSCSTKKTANSKRQMLLC